MTEYLADPAAAREWCERERNLGKSIGYVPTMGALHDGHLSLVDRSRSENDVTCVSIFVNPLQFNNPQDLEKYPQNIEQDLKFLGERHCNMTYSGKLEDFFPGEGDITKIKPSFVASAIAGLEADHRPGHLEGVQAIVEKLFKTVGPCRAYFGEKDFQQCFLVREIAAWIENIEIVVCPTIREASGLAMSSRNQRLSADGRKLAQNLYKALASADKAYRAGLCLPDELEKLMHNVLDIEGIDIEYTAIRATNSWTATTPQKPVEPAQALVAATIEGVRLIDNMGLGTAASRIGN
jgi:pantoate--beta-alanine ligase